MRLLWKLPTLTRVKARIPGRTEPVPELLCTLSGDKGVVSGGGFIKTQRAKKLPVSLYVCMYICKCTHRGEACHLRLPTADPLKSCHSVTEARYYALHLLWRHTAGLPGEDLHIQAAWTKFPSCLQKGGLHRGVLRLSYKRFACSQDVHRFLRVMQHMMLRIRANCETELRLWCWAESRENLLVSDLRPVPKKTVVRAAAFSFAGFQLAHMPRYKDTFPLSLFMYGGMETWLL